MKGIVLIVVLAIVVEALVEYGKSLIAGFKTGGWKAPAVQLVAMAVAVLLCFAANADLFTVLGVEFSAPWIGTLLTGIFASRGSNYISDLIGKLQAGKVPGAAPDGDEG